MKLSELWLREWVKTTIDISTLADQITMSGMEVNSIEAVTREFNNLVVGHVVECYNNNNLWITKVDVSGPNLLNIMCTAPNCRSNLRVVVDLVRTELSNKCSQGKLCSCYDLGITNDKNNINIIELPNDAPIGCNLSNYWQYYDNIIDISVTPNRADCLGIIGIAREVAIVNNLSLPKVSIKPVAPVSNYTLPINIEDSVACPSYIGRIITGIDASTITPIWIQERLIYSKISLVNVIVDITNYIMIEYGYPMHAFDLKAIDNCIIVRQAKPKDKLTLLNKCEITLTQDTLVIADKNKVLSIAGILGGIQSSIKLNSSDIFLECAFFNNVSIIGRARKYGLQTEASLRYERGVDHRQQLNVIERATSLLLEICGGQPGPVINITHTDYLPKKNTIILSRVKLDSLIGHFIPDKLITDIMVRIGCTVSNIKNYGWQIIVPSWRIDLEIEENIIAEVMRVYGYNNIPSVAIKSNLFNPHIFNKEANLTLERIKLLLIDRGYHEAITYSFINPTLQELFYPGKKMLRLPNPISIDMSAMRLSLVPGLISVVVYNQNRQQKNLRIFESGLCFTQDNNIDQTISQNLLLAGTITGLSFDNHWDSMHKQVDFYDIKGDIEAILELTGQLESFEFKAQENPMLHPGQSAAIYFKNELIGWIGVIHPKLEEQLNLNNSTLVFELILEKITNRKIPEATSLSLFPTTCRDIAVVVAEEVRSIDIINECKKNINTNLISINIFDVYKGKGISKGFKSLAIRLILQNNKKTLEEKKITAMIYKCLAALKNRFNANLRDETYGS
ncbi:phenylalanine--tRNA ligase subunit beta [Candidatus Palibaumannia cicadellinicola]|uniref:Phenylalanine--tRNA ligase beta subunit n=1 Tax=Candidatus Palibaumannia cicadellinicola TaxID=186490 RepID=A0A0K2BLS7_9GAMM|nr:phenylalanine--tRNA ligase subunit beta [Candidatus Baumannia cicadellinicola]AKZ66003.1 Phenylalanyl-tRNA synthetase beta chain [Candidatus Baumannia cicadellinicola]